MKRTAAERNVGDGSGGGTHPHADGGGFKGGARGGGGADNAMAIANGDFAVGAQIESMQ